ncbi:uncharacterized protein LOC127137890 [Lathyrus oleraceus]|uniref:uncharacterized protein LOC127137890 n=1 Tax=Pisum sativum TaxID=3888 RepID=UPI0021D051EB|nr:uncharacterized protein LOC127137890 [Pisum sativum]
MPAHNGSAVNAIEDGETLNLIMDVNLVTHSLPFVKEYLIKNDVYPECFPKCCKCKSQPEGCDDLKAGTQSLITEGFLKFDRIVKDKKIEETDVALIYIPYTSINIPAPTRPTPLTITFTGPISYSSERVVPWHYGSDVYYHGVKQEDEPSKEKSCVDDSLNVGNLAGTGRITRSGRVFPSPSTQDNADALAKDKDITVNQLEGVMASISADNGMGFTDFDLPHEGGNHNKAPHIFMECKGTTLSRALVDIRSSLNVLPKSAWMKIDYTSVKLRPSDLIVRAFDGSRRVVFCEEHLPVQFGPQVFDTTLFVMDIQPVYCCLLGRPWIHRAGDVTSTLYQKIKFPVGGKVITICGEEEYKVSHLAFFRYVEVEGEFHETPFQAFEVVQVIKTPSPEEKKPTIPMSSLKEARVVVEAGHPKVGVVYWISIQNSTSLVSVSIPTVKVQLPEL